MILESGNKVLIAHRRLFDTDQPRFFTGLVEAYEDGVARVEGHSWSRDSFHGTFARKGDLRTKIVSLSSGTVIVYKLPSSVDLGSLEIRVQGTDLLATDKSGFRMDLTENVVQAASASNRPPAAR
ncbi:MAG: hypothetical protein NTY35_07385 [Planctomycetota bacterium]|nr:hypothetical protein [Planctomycetota bacterium]